LESSSSFGLVQVKVKSKSKEPKKDMLAEMALEKSRKRKAKKEVFDNSIICVLLLSRKKSLILSSQMEG
jgi:hypothetical protein